MPPVYSPEKQTCLPFITSVNISFIRLSPDASTKPNLHYWHLTPGICLIDIKHSLYFQYTGHTSVWQFTLSSYDYDKLFVKRARNGLVIYKSVGKLKPFIQPQAPHSRLSDFDETPWSWCFSLRCCCWWRQPRWSRHGSTEATGRLRTDGDVSSISRLVEVAFDILWLVFM